MFYLSKCLKCWKCPLSLRVLHYYKALTLETLHKWYTPKPYQRFYLSLFKQSSNQSDSIFHLSRGLKLFENSFVITKTYRLPLQVFLEFRVFCSFLKCVIVRQYLNISRCLSHWVVNTFVSSPSSRRRKDNRKSSNGRAWRKGRVIKETLDIIRWVTVRERERTFVSLNHVTYEVFNLLMSSLSLGFWRTTMRCPLTPQPWSPRRTKSLFGAAVNNTQLFVLYYIQNTSHKECKDSMHCFSLNSYKTARLVRDDIHFGRSCYSVAM